MIELSQDTIRAIRRRQYVPTIAEIVDLITDLQKAHWKITALEEDKARLDWLDGAGCLTTYRDRDPEDGKLSSCVVVPEGRVNRRGFVGDTWRSAIDAARQAEKK